MIAQRSQCIRAKVGAVIVDAENRMVSVGYNGGPRGGEFADPCDGSESPKLPFCLRGRFGPTTETATTYEDCFFIHAEQNALTFSGWRERHGGTLYVTGPVCWICARNITNSFLARVVIANEVTDRSYRQPDEVIEFLREHLEVVLL